MLSSGGPLTKHTYLANNYNSINCRSERDSPYIVLNGVVRGMNVTVIITIGVVIEASVELHVREAISHHNVTLVQSYYD